MNNYEELLDLYRHENDILLSSYDLMGTLLNDKLIKKRINEIKLEKMYIYGGGYLGIQSFKILKKYLDVISIVDKGGRLKIDIDGIPVIDLVSLKKIYKNEAVLITPIQYSKEIYNDLTHFIPDKNIILLGQLVKGGC